MTGLVKKTALAAVALALSAQPAQACWNSTAQDAAKIKHLNTMLMVNALRCRNGADNFLPQYNRFVTKHSALIGSQNAVLKNSFAATLGARGAEGALDRMSIGYANSYGTGHRRLSCRDMKAIAQKLSTESHGAATMAAVADIAIDNHQAPVKPCPATFAQKR